VIALQNYYSKIGNIVLTFSNVINDKNGFEEIIVRFERASDNGFDYSEWVLPGRFNRKAFGFSEDEIMSQDRYLLNNMLLIWEMARENEAVTTSEIHSKSHLNKYIDRDDYMKFIEFTIEETSRFESKEEYDYDWTKRSSPISIVVGNIRDGDIVGLVEFERQQRTLYNYMWLIEVSQSYRGGSVAGELLAYVGRDSLQQGFDGFYFFEAKSCLYEYYQIRYGAKPSDGRRLFFDTEAIKNLISRYLLEERL